MTDQADARLQAQYEAYPYPQRDPRDEAKRLITGSPGHLLEVDHWVFGASRTASRPLRALIAGGGSGDATIMLAQQMAKTGRSGSVTWLDRSSAALKVAQARAAARGLTNIVWEQRSLLDLPGSDLGLFDYIDCCGVLHHLPDPAEGLRALLSVLAPGGGMGLMVYARYGRTGVYMLQDGLRLLTPPDQEPEARLDVARRMMKHLPETAWLRANRSVTDHLKGGDAGLYDLLLNPRDRAFDVPELHDLLAGEGLSVTCWVEPLRYDPVPLLPDPRLRARIATLTPIERMRLAEALAGNIASHIVYCTRAGEPPVRADPFGPDAVPVCRETTGEDIVKGIQTNNTMFVILDGLRVPLPLSPMAPTILPLVDGKRTISEIGSILASRGIGSEAFERAWRALFPALESINRLLLAAPVGVVVPAFAPPAGA
jgi:2-polyprenyl-3-methyl-5-hydroxy-6-metoxy-1,4-benzoquinol methylase